MKLQLKPIAVAIALSLPVALPVHGSGIPVYDATAWQQQVQELQHMARSLANEARMISNQLQQYAELIRQGRALLAGDWLAIAGEISGLNEILSEGASIAYTAADLEQQFRQAFTGYVSPHDWRAAYQDWSTRGLDTMRTTLAAMNRHDARLGPEDDRLRDLVRLSDNADGRMQALQAGNRIAAEQAQQMMALQSMIATQTSAQAVYFSTQMNRDAAAEAALMEGIHRAVKPIPIYGNGMGPGAENLGSVPVLGAPQ